MAEKQLNFSTEIDDQATEPGRWNRLKQHGWALAKACGRGALRGAGIAVETGDGLRFDVGGTISAAARLMENPKSAAAGLAKEGLSGALSGGKAELIDRAPDIAVDTVNALGFSQANRAAAYRAFEQSGYAAPASGSQESSMGFDATAYTRGPVAPAGAAPMPAPVPAGR